MTLLNLFRKEEYRKPGAWQLVCENYQTHCIRFLYQGKWWRFPVEFGKYWTVYAAKPEIAEPVEFRDDLRETEERILNCLRAEASSLKNNQETPKIDVGCLIITTSPDIPCPKCDFLWEVSCGSLIWQYDGERTETGGVVHAETRRLYTKVPYTGELRDEFEQLKRDWIRYSKHRHGIDRLLFTEEEYPKQTIRTVGLWRNDLTIFYEGSTYHFFSEFDGDNIVFANTIRRLWPLGSETCTKEDKRRVVEGTREFVERKGYRYSDIDPDVYYSAVKSEKY